MSDPEELGAPVVHVWATGQDVGEEFLLALDAGQVPPGMREELADAGVALGARLSHLAAEVRGGGRFAWRRAVELAVLLCTAAPSDAGHDAESKSGR